MLRAYTEQCAVSGTPCGIPHQISPQLSPQVPGQPPGSWFLWAGSVLGSRWGPGPATSRAALGGVEVPLWGAGAEGSVPPREPPAAPGPPWKGHRGSCTWKPIFPPPWLDKSHTKTCSGHRGMSVGQEGWAPQELSWWALGRTQHGTAGTQQNNAFQWACPCAAETLQPIHNWEGDAVQPHGQQIQLGFSLPECGTRSNLSFLKNVITECNGNASKRLQEQDPCLKS